MSSITNHHRISGAAAAKLLSAHRLTVTSRTLMHRSNQGVTVAKTQSSSKSTANTRLTAILATLVIIIWECKIRSTVGTDVPLHDQIHHHLSGEAAAKLLWPFLGSSANRSNHGVTIATMVTMVTIF